jgi:hypothetical protein
MPERLPQARLAMTVESLGLKTTQKRAYKTPFQLKHTKQEIKAYKYNGALNIAQLNKFRESSPFRLPKRSERLVNRKAYRYTRSNTL